MTPKPHTRAAREKRHTVLAVRPELHTRIKETKPPRYTLAGYVDFLIEKALENPRHIRALNLAATAPDLLATLQAIGGAIEDGDPQEIADQWHHAKATIVKATEERGEA
jgi:hypothetical protein